MKRMAKRCLSILMIYAIITGGVRAQDESSGSARVSDQPGPLPSEPTPIFANVAGPPSTYFPMTPVETWFAPRFYVDARGGTLYGYEESFSSLGGFVPYFYEDNSMLFVDGRGMVGYDGRGGANVGAGMRHYVPGWDRFFGLNAWYDFDSSHQRSYNQFGLGFESIGRYFDMIANGYIPVGKDFNTINSFYGTNVEFAGNQILLDRFNQTETAYTGFDIQVGGPMPLLGRYGLQGYTGFYFFTGSNNGDFTGVSGRLAWQLNEDVNLAVNMTDDHTFGTNTQIQVSLSLPDGKPSRWLRPLSVRDRMMQSTLRNYRVTVEQETRLVQEAAINPRDNQPYFVVHIDPNVAGVDVPAGTGTVEDPFNLISQFDNLAFNDKSPVDIIYVQPRADDTTTNLDTGVTLLTGQRLLSSSVPHTFLAAQQPNMIFNLPGYNPNGTQLNLPILSNRTGGNVITFADGAFDVEVSGFEVNGSATGSGIVGTNNRAVNINRNVITSGLNGVALTNLTGLQSSGEGSFFTGNIIRNNLNDGINISNSGAAPLDLVIANNPTTTSDFNGVLDIDTDADGVNDASSPESLDGDGSFANDGILANGDDGIDINADAGSIITVAVDNNLIRGNQDNGIEMDATAASTIRGAITNNTLSGNQDNGIQLSANNSSLDFFAVAPSGLQGGISGNEIRDNVSDGLEINAVQSVTSFDINTNRFGVSSFDLTDPNLLVGANGAWGINLNADGGSTLIEIGGATAAEGNIFVQPGFGAIVYNLTGNNLTSSNIQFNQIVSAVADTGDLLRAGFNGATLAGNDDGSTGLVGIGFDANFFGVLFNQVYVNNNGNVTLNAPLGTFTPFNIIQNQIPMIAAFFADVDTRLGNEVTYGTGTVNGQNAFGVNWEDVRHFSVDGTNQGLPTNSFQMVLIDRSDIAPGDFDIEFNYDSILWESGEASGSDPFGLGGASARVGYTNGVNAAFELPGSAVNGALLDGGPATTSLVQNSLNSSIDGRYVFQARNGVVLDPTNNNNGPPGETAAIRLNVSDTAQLTNSFVQDNVVTGQTNANLNQFALSVNTNDLAQVSNFTVRDNTFNQNDGGIQLNRNDSSNIQAFVDNNTVNGNRGNGFEIIAAGTALGGVFVTSQDNQFDDNDGDGLNILATGNSIVRFDSSRDAFTNSGGDNIQIRTDDDADVIATFANLIATGATGNGFNVEAEGTSNLVLNIGSPADPLFNGTQSIFSNNGQNGLNVLSGDTALALINIQDTAFANNGGDGANFRREDSSLLLVNINNSTFTGNDDDGLQFYATGTDRQDPNTPLFDGTIAPASRLRLINSTVSENGVRPTFNADGTVNVPGSSPNGGNGLEFSTEADAVFISKVISTSITNNATDGVRAFATGIASYGEDLDRSEFDNVTITGNLRDGIKLFAMGQLGSTPDMFVEVNSNSGNTLISDNGDDGIQASVPYGSIDLNVEGTNGTLRIQRNGFIGTTPTGGGNGIEFNVADTAIDGDDAGDTLASNNGERTDGDWDGSANEILNFYFPTGFEFTGVDGYNGFGTLNVTNVIIGDDNLNDAVALGNANDGIQIFNSNIWNFIGGGNDGTAGGATFVGPTTDALGNALVPASAANDHDVNRDLIVDGAFGAGNVGRTVIFDQAGVMTFTMDNTIVGGNGRDGLNIISDGNNGAFEPGNLVAAIVTDSTIVSNGRHGVNIDLEGRHGEYAIGFGPGGTYTVTAANQFIFDNNVIARNNNYGFRYQANAGVIQRPNLGILPDTYFWSEQFQDGVQPTNPPGRFDPTFIRDNTNISAIFNTTGNTPGITSQFYSIATELNSRLTFTNNDVRNNGRLNQGFNEGGDGLFIRVSTNSYLSADIGGAAGSGNGNTFSGNALADVRFESFTASWVNGTSYAVPNVSTAGATTTLDQLFLDDTAQMTLRFNNNIGRELNADRIVFIGVLGQRTAGYDTNGTAFIGNLSGIRTTQMFQVDDAANLDANNTWVSDLDSEFSAASWYLVPVADPAFPNPIFPENINEDYGDPYFPF